MWALCYVKIIGVGLFHLLCTLKFINTISPTGWTLLIAFVNKSDQVSTGRTLLQHHSVSDIFGKHICEGRNWWCFPGGLQTHRDALLNCAVVLCFLVLENEDISYACRLHLFSLRLGNLNNKPSDWWAICHIYYYYLDKNEGIHMLVCGGIEVKERCHFVHNELQVLIIISTRFCSSLP